MKKILTLTFFVFSMMNAISQTDGISYQAVIIAPEDLELPGVDSEGNYLPNTAIAIRFTIYDSGNQLEFQEVQYTETDDFGRINLLIGDGDHDYFKEMNWDGTPKDLKVEIDFEAGSNFEEMSRERLTFLPYSYHRNIRATQDLLVEGNTKLEGELEVELPTQLNSSLDVTNDTNLDGILNVTGDTNLNSTFNVLNGSLSNLTGDLAVGGNSALNGTLDVLGLTTLNDLRVNGDANFGNLTVVDLEVTNQTTLDEVNVYAENLIRLKRTPEVEVLFNSEPTIEDHAVLIEGTKQGLAILVNEARKNNTNFITFFDDDDGVIKNWGRIEGERESEFENNADYRFDKRNLLYDRYDAIFDAGVSAYELAKTFTNVGIASTSSTACVGFGACITSPIPSWIIGSTAQTIVAGLQLLASGGGVVLAEINIANYNDDKVELQGVTYASGAGDYAEYLLREDISEKMSYGDIVGVKGGRISKNLKDAERMMVVSFKPIVLGNMPEPNRESEYEKIAFMGQVPVKVFGKVSIGDYILPSGKDDGIGRALNPADISAKQLNDIVGVAWTASNDPLGIRLINTAVGVNRNDSSLIIEKLEIKIDQQAHEITYLKNQIESILGKITDIENGTTSVQLASNTTAKESHSKFEVIESTENDVIYHEITKDDFEKGLLLAEKTILSGNKNGENDKLVEALNKLKTDAGFKTKFFNRIQEELRKQIHFHQEIDRKGRH